MAEHLGEKLSQLKEKRGAERESSAASCVELILKVWERRHALADGVRPLSAFEPLFRALSELSQKKSRYFLLRSLPKTKSGNRAERIISSAVALDGAVSVLIRYCLAEAVSGIPAKDKRWAKLRAATAELPWDIEIVLATTSDAETLIEKKKGLREAEIRTVKGMLGRLKTFEKKSADLRSVLENKLKSLR